MEDKWKNKVEKIEGLDKAVEESLRPSSNSAHTLSDLVVDEQSKTAAYIVDIHYYQGGIGMYAMVYAYANGELVELGQGDYRHNRDPRMDNYQVQWTKINKLEIKENKGKVEVSSPMGNSRSYDFEIKQNQQK